MGVHTPIFSQFCCGKWPLYRARFKLSILARIVVLVAGLKNFIFFVFLVVVVATADLVTDTQPTK